MTPLEERLVDDLAELVAIPSVSADPAHRADLHRAAEWVRDRIARAGGSAELLGGERHPFVVGEIRASLAPESAPTVLCYAHVDVQPADPVELWETPPFELTRRNGWLVGRGVADDKAHAVLMVAAAEELASRGELPVNVRFVADGEEEVGGTSVADWLESDGRGADAALVLDGLMVRPGQPAFIVALRGICFVHVAVRTGAGDLHSGAFGGVALNAVHALAHMLQAVLPGRDGRLPEPLRAGLIPPGPEEIAAWELLPPGEEELAVVGARPVDSRAAEEFYLRTTAEPSLEVNGVDGGSAHLLKTVLPATAHANLSVRLAPGQSPRAVLAALERLLWDAAPRGAEVSVELLAEAEPAHQPADDPALVAAQDAFERVVGARPVLFRTGASLPFAAALRRLGIPMILTGFNVRDANAHAPNERFPAGHLELGVATIAEVLRGLGNVHG